MKRIIINLINKIINKVKTFINEHPRLRCYIYSVIASAFEGRMAEFVFIDYIYYISSNVVEAVIKKHPRYFFGAFFRKHVNKLTLRGFILREFLISYLMLLLNELDQAKRHEWFKKRHEERMAELRIEMKIWLNNLPGAIFRQLMRPFIHIGASLMGLVYVTYYIAYGLLKLGFFTILSLLNTVKSTIETIFYIVKAIILVGSAFISFCKYLFSLLK